MKIFLSYSWNNSTIADSLDNLFDKKSIQLERDIRDIEYRQSIKEFMKKVRFSDFCIVLISKSYLTSTNCMYEITEFMKDENYIDRILPLVQKDTDIFNIAGRNKYVSFWQDKYKEVNDSLASLDELNKIETIKELKRIENIQRDIGEFLSIISDMNNIVFNNNIEEKEFDIIYSSIKVNNKLILDIFEKIKLNNSNSIVIRTNEFPEIQFLVTGDIHNYYPPYEVQILFDYENSAYIEDHINEIKSTFSPIIILGEELKTNIIRKDTLGIRIKTNYSSSKDRNKVFNQIALIIYNLYYRVIDLSQNQKLIFEEYNQDKHLPIPEELW